MCGQIKWDYNVRKVGNDRGGIDLGLFHVIFPAIAWNDWRKPWKTFGQQMPRQRLIPNISHIRALRVSRYISRPFHWTSKRFGSIFAKFDHTHTLRVRKSVSSHSFTLNLPHFCIFTWLTAKLLVSVLPQTDSSAIKSFVPITAV
jgi:hypothetical protein